MDFNAVVGFHGHACPGLALGYRVSKLVLRELAGGRSGDEELVAVIENNSCAVDAIQAMCGCTFGKGNLIFHDYGKQVYTFIRRRDDKFMRIAVKWEPPAESENVKSIWKKYAEGDRSPEVLAVVHERKAKKLEAVLAAEESELFQVSTGNTQPPAAARIYPSILCSSCGEKVMAPKAVDSGKGPLCIPCADGGGGAAASG